MRQIKGSLLYLSSARSSSDRTAAVNNVVSVGLSPIGYIACLWHTSQGRGRVTKNKEYEMGKSDIGWAVDQLKSGKRICRSGWNGKGMWLEIDQQLNPGSSLIRRSKHENNRSYAVANHVWMKTAQDTYIPWLCSQSDLFANDWELVE